MVDVAAKIKSKNLKEAYKLGQDLVASAQFQSLILPDQHWKLLTVGALGLKLRDLEYAHRLLARGWDAKQIGQRNAAQWPIQKKMDSSHHVVWTEAAPEVDAAQLARIIP